MNNGVYHLKGSIQHYAWGGNRFIPSLLGLKNTENKASAEYWLGAHLKSPAKVKMDNEWVDLIEFISSNPGLVLGETTEKKFSGLPYLLKVLDVSDMLSIQVHPTREEAKIGFARENKLNIPLDAPNRNYKDDNHKPEVMVALSEFWLLHGFLPQDRLLNQLKSIPEFSHLIEVFETKGYKGIYQYVMEEPQDSSNNILKRIIDRILPLYQENRLEKSQPDYWAAKAFLTFCQDKNIDKGIYSIYFLNLVKINPGKAIFQDAGILHAYLEGQNMELMANSDNVLRGGLTPKHVDIEELMGIVRFEGTEPLINEGSEKEDGKELVYHSPVDDFVLSKIELIPGQEYSSTSKSMEIIIVMEGKVEVDGKVIRKGETILATANSKYTLNGKERSIAFKAAVNI